MVRKTNHEATSAEGKKERKPVITMVPIFSWRTIVAVIFGLIVGVGLGLGYWIMSPALGLSGISGTGTSGTGTSGTGTGTVAAPAGLFGLLGMEHTGLYESKVRVQVVSLGSEYVPLSGLQQRAEYYAAKASSLPFFEFLSQELAEQVPGYSYTIDELDQIITTSYDWNSELPTIRITTIGTTAQEAVLLAELVPLAFKSFLIAEESDKRQREYQETLEEIEIVKADLYEAEQELSALESPEVANDIQNDPTYIALNAKVESLELELENQAAELALTISVGDVSEIRNRQQQLYEQTLQEVRDKSIALSKAKKELNALEMQLDDSSDVSNTETYIETKAKIQALEFQLNLKMTDLSVQIAEGITDTRTQKDIERISAAIVEAKEELSRMENQSGVDGFVEDVEYQLAQAKVDTLNAEIYALRERLVQLINESNNQYNREDIQASFERTSAALAKARKELATLESLNQEGQLDYDRLAMDLDYKVAQEKVDNLNIKLKNLTEQLSSLSEDNVDSWEITGYLVPGKPSVPYPLLPERPRASNTLMMGAIGGVVVAWAILNFRWIAKGMPSSNTAKPDEEET